MAKICRKILNKKNIDKSCLITRTRLQFVFSIVVASTPASIFPVAVEINLNKSFLVCLNDCTTISLHARYGLRTSRLN